MGPGTTTNRRWTPCREVSKTCFLLFPRAQTEAGGRLATAWPRPLDPPGCALPVTEHGGVTGPARSYRTRGPSEKTPALETPISLAEGFSDPHGLLSKALLSQPPLPSLLQLPDLRGPSLICPVNPRHL